MTNDPTVTGPLAAAFDAMDDPAQARVADIFRKASHGAPAGARAAWRHALARFAARRTARSANEVVAAALDLSPDARDGERRMFDPNGLPMRGGEVDRIFTALLDLLDVTAHPLAVRNIDALRDAGVHAVALPATFLDAHGRVIGRAAIVQW